MDIYHEIAEKRATGETFILATIVRIKGSSPRDVGAKMLVFPNGTISGTIGGGKFEKMVIDDSLGLFAGDSNHLLKTYRFSQTGPDATGMYCGGEAEVFMEINARPKRLIVFGGGHVGRELVRLAGDLGFKISVVDDRQTVLDEYHSPIETILTDSEFNNNFPSVYSDCYVVLVTHGHQGDQSVLAKVVKENCAYVGMIGSKKKIARIYSCLEEAGIDRKLLEKVHAPIGLDIGAEGPYEIAVSIIAEIISTKRKTPRKT